MKATAFPFADDGDIPNSRLPLILYAGAIDPATGDAVTAFEELFAANGWPPAWRNGIYPFHHYHSTAHEVLGIARGRAEVRFGGEKGKTVTVAAGDAVLIPAGVGHRRLTGSADLLVVGGYPPGQSADLMREGAPDGRAVRRRIAAVPRPAEDPVAGGPGPLARLWPG